MNGKSQILEILDRFNAVKRVEQSFIQHAYEYGLKLRTNALFVKRSFETHIKRKNLNLIYLLIIYTFLI